MALTDEQRRLVEDNFNLIYHVLKGFPSAKLKWDDYVQAASEGLCKAALYFKPEYGWEFSTYAVPMVYGTICRHYRDYDCRFIKIPREMIDKKEFPEIIWLDAPVPGQRDGNIQAHGYDIIEDPDDEVSQEDQVIYKVMTDYIQDNFDDNLKTFYNLRFKNGYKQTVIAELMGISQAQVSRIEKKVREKFHTAFAV